MKPGTDYIGVGLGAFIFNEKGELFLMKRGAKTQNEQGCWIVPGGKLEYGETLADGIVREVKEELGVTIAIDEQFPAHDHILAAEDATSGDAQNGSAVAVAQHWVTNQFRAHIVEGTPQNLEPGKCDETGWFSLDDLPSPIAFANHAVIAELIERKNTKETHGK
jgi:8-oxo-dGTP diphosphatase